MDARISSINGALENVTAWVQSVQGGRRTDVCFSSVYNASSHASAVGVGLDSSLAMQTATDCTTGASAATVEDVPPGMAGHHVRFDPQHLGQQQAPAPTPAFPGTQRPPNTLSTSPNAAG